MIDFGDRSQAVSAAYDLPFGRLTQRVKAERMANNRKVYRDYWWQYAEKRPAMRRAIAELSEVLVIALVSKSVMPMRVPTGQVFSHMLGVFAFDDYGTQAVLSSNLHQLWAITYGSGMRSDPRYTPSDVFETFPRPAPSDALEGVGRRLDEERRAIMLRRGLGATKLYNLVNDAAVSDMVDQDVARMRGLHAELDQAVLNAYGWSDINPDHGLYTFRKMQRWTVSPEARTELLDRLLEENHRRAARQPGACTDSPDVASDCTLPFG